jgi:hypothetical protein
MFNETLRFNKRTMRNPVDRKTGELFRIAARIKKMATTAEPCRRCQGVL